MRKLVAEKGLKWSKIGRGLKLVGISFKASTILDIIVLKFYLIKQSVLD